MTVHVVATDENIEVRFEDTPGITYRCFFNGDFILGVSSEVTVSVLESDDNCGSLR